MAKGFSLVAPWQTYRKMLAAIFTYDNDVKVGEAFETGSGDDKVVHIPVEVLRTKKCKALAKVLNTNIIFGKVRVNVDLYDVENGESSTNLQTFRDIFNGNSIVSSFKTVRDSCGVDHYYVVFDNDEIIQFPNDDLTDYRGNFNGLPEDVARELFSVPGNIQFCTKSLSE